MRKEFDEELDLQIRSIMEEAQEPAPAGAWKAISSRLDALQGAAAGAGATRLGAAASRPVRRAWYWAGAALAAAAAVALGIFFTGTSDNNSNLIDINSGSGLVAESLSDGIGAPIPESDMVREPILPEKTAVPAEKPADSRPQPAKTAAPAGNTVNSRPQPAADVTAQPDVEAQPGDKAQPSVQEQHPVQAQSAAPAEKAAAAPDPFARMAYEDSRRASSSRRGVSLLVKGGSTGNNAGAGKLAMAAPGAYQQSGITETSKSSFGVPVIAGIGLRLHLNDVLSVGTGIDYSLLTRSFEGRYVEGLSVQNGDFNHTLQYIGIPIDFFVKLVDKNDITLYSVVGTEAEKAVSNKYRLLGTDVVVGDRVNGLQWSVGAGLGLEINVSRRVGIFAEPSVKYYFNCDQPKNLRTDKPFQMVLRAGVRFDL